MLDAGDLQHGWLPGRMIEVVPGRSGASETFLDPADPIFAEHFPDWPVLPGSFVLRAALATAACIDGAPSWRLGQIQRLTYRQGAQPGTVLRIDVERRDVPIDAPGHVYAFIARTDSARIADGAFDLVVEAHP